MTNSLHIEDAIRNGTFTAGRPILINGVRYRPGDVIDSANIADRTLMLLYKQRKIVPRWGDAPTAEPVADETDAPPAVTEAPQSAAGSEGGDSAPEPEGPSEPRKEAVEPASEVVKVEAPRFSRFHKGFGRHVIVDSEGKQVSPEGTYYKIDEADQKVAEMNEGAA